MQLSRLDHGGDTVVIDTAAGLPAIVHWGPDPGPLQGLDALLDRARPPGTLDVEPPATLLPTPASGWPGRPGFAASRGHEGVFPRFADVTWSVTGSTFTFEADDPCGVSVAGTIALGDVLEVVVSVTNRGHDDLHVASLAPVIPLPAAAAEVLRFDGRWCHEFHPRRMPWPAGTHLLENRRGRTSHDTVPVVFAGPAGFDESTGVVHGIHLAWSGNHEVVLDRLADGRRVVQAGELLLPGEVVLARGETHQAPRVIGAVGTGLTECSRRFHEHVRAALPRRPRPVLLNTWEAVYFDHDLDRLRALADRAAQVGVERFVLDDGWFGGRRDDTAGLGDWVVSPDAHPDGLGPLIDHVTGLGMEFGIWVEPEMVNPDSDLYRSHPDWVLGDAAVLGRNQLVLDLGIDACRQHLFDQLDRLLSDHDIAFVKWDMNRDLAGAGSHRQTHALYRLLDDLGAAHPDVEIESCASGGGRADAEILRRTCRIWTSDCNDPLERQTIQRGFSHFLPPEVMGAHIGPPRAHTTGRTSRLAFRAATALFGHLGIEWNLLDASDRHLDALAEWIALHKRLRPLLHGGDVVRLDRPDPGGIAHGVVATDRAEALFASSQVAAGPAGLAPPLVLRDLDPDRVYRVERLAMPGEVLGLGLHQPAWIDTPAHATGRALMTVGLELPVLFPESTLLVHLTS